MKARKKIRWEGPGWYVVSWATEDEVILGKIADGSKTHAQVVAMAQAQGFIQVIWHGEKPVYMEVINA